MIVGRKGKRDGSIVEREGGKRYGGKGRRKEGRDRKVEREVDGMGGMEGGRGRYGGREGRRGRYGGRERKVGREGEGGREAGTVRPSEKRK